MEDLASFPVYTLFSGKLDYLLIKNQSVSEKDNRAAAKALEAQKLHVELQELDKEMSRLIGQGLETRKMDKHQPQSSEVYLPYSGLIQRQSGSSSSPASPTGVPSILLKKKKKTVIKSLTK